MLAETYFLAILDKVNYVVTDPAYDAEFLMVDNNIFFWKTKQNHENKLTIGIRYFGFVEPFKQYSRRYKSLLVGATADYFVVDKNLVSILNQPMIEQMDQYLIKRLSEGKATRTKFYK